MALKALFPTLDYTRAGVVNLDTAARRLYGVAADASINPLLDPGVAQAMVDTLHRELGVEWSYGGYLEDRAFLLRGTYLDEQAGYLHMGIDCNTPPGTVVATPFEGEVVDLFDDRDERQGWGPRVIVATGEPRAPYLVFGHLGPHRHSVGTRLQAGESVGEIAPPPFNGFWFPHLHLQILSERAFRRHAETRFLNLDGYGHPIDRAELIEDYPDPSWLVEELHP